MGVRENSEEEERVAVEEERMREIRYLWFLRRVIHSHT